MSRGRARRGAVWLETLVLVGALVLVVSGAVRAFSGSLEQAFASMGDGVRQWTETPSSSNGQLAPPSGASRSSAPPTRSIRGRRTPPGPTPDGGARLWLANMGGADFPSGGGAERDPRDRANEERARREEKAKQDKAKTDFEKAIEQAEKDQQAAKERPNTKKNERVFDGVAAWFTAAAALAMAAAFAVFAP